MAGEEGGRNDNNLWTRKIRLGLFRCSCMIILSIIQTACYFLNWNIRDKSGNLPNFAREGMIAEALIYLPDKKRECWRMITYMLIHLDFTNLMANVLLQLMGGMWLVQKNPWWRVLIVYIAGGATGCLSSSILEPNHELVGASGGVYAIATSNISNVIVNWKQMKMNNWVVGVLCISLFGVLPGLFLSVIFETDSTSIVSHWGGAIAGFLSGFYVLTNDKLNQEKKN